MEKRRRQVRKVTCRKTFPPSIGARRNRALEKARVEIGGEKEKGDGEGLVRFDRAKEEFFEMRRKSCDSCKDKIKAKG